MVVDFFVGVVADDPLADSKEGVKLGDSTLNRFLLLLVLQVSHYPLKPRMLTSTKPSGFPGYSNLSELFVGFILCGSWLKAQPLAMVRLYSQYRT